MRTTIYLPDELLAEIKKLAADTHTTVTALIEDALRERLARRKKKPQLRAARLVTYGKKGILPGVDLDDTAALLDLMEKDNNSHRR
jgi:hypothetical protein